MNWNRTWIIACGFMFLAEGVLPAEESPGKEEARTIATLPQGVADADLFVSPTGLVVARREKTGAGQRWIVFGPEEAAGWKTHETFGTVSDPVFSPDGRRVAYVAVAASGWKGGTRVVVDGVASEAWDDCRGVSFSADSSTWMYVGGRGGFYSGTEYDDDAPATYGGGEFFAIVNGKVVATPGFLPWTALHMSPDGRRLAWVTGEHGALTLMVDGKAVGRKHQTIDSICFAPDGKSVSCVVTDRVGECYVEINGVAALERFRTARNLVFGAEGTLAYVCEDSTGHNLMIGGRRVKSYTAIHGFTSAVHPAYWAWETGTKGWFVEHAGRRGPLFERSGGSISVSADATVAAYSAVRDGRTVIVVGTAEYGPYEGRVGDPIMSADGKSAGFWHRTGTTVHWRISPSKPFAEAPQAIAAGKVDRRATEKILRTLPAEANLMGVEVGFQGKLVAWVTTKDGKQQAEIWSSDGGFKTSETFDNVSNISLNPDGKGAAIMGKRGDTVFVQTINLASMAPGAWTPRIYGPYQEVRSGLQWHPDGRGLAWTARSDGEIFAVFDGAVGPAGVTSDLAIHPNGPIHAPCLIYGLTRDSRACLVAQEWHETGEPRRLFGDKKGEECSGIRSIRLNSGGVSEKSGGTEVRAASVIAFVAVKADGQHMVLADLVPDGEPEGVLQWYKLDNVRIGPAFEEIDDLVLSPDGLSSAYSCRKGIVWKVMLGGKALDAQAEEGEWPEGLTLHPEGSSTAWININHDFTTFFVQDGRPSPGRGDVYSPSYSPIGRHVAYLEVDPGKVTRLIMNGSRLQEFRSVIRYFWGELEGSVIVIERRDRDLVRHEIPLPDRK